MTALDDIVNIVLAVVLIVGAYQFYFWCQRQTRMRARTFSFSWDHAIRLRPGWVWIYSGIYYPAIAVVVLSVHNPRDFNYMAFSYLLLLGVHILVFLIYPVEVPPNWRETDVRSPSRRFLTFVQGFDARSNCFPSVHVSVATLTALHTVRNLACNPSLPALFVFLICASCVLTKQHYIIDLPTGLFAGWLAFRLFLFIL